MTAGEHALKMNGVNGVSDVSQPSSATTLEHGPSLFTENRVWCLASDGSYYEFDQIPARSLL